ncbi:IS66 family insertion sequence element accessory protein TnpA [Magnetofaba australis]|uniref:IS66 family insertion sequence element accessory protein TnpA n=1 Tax=Magnetofaba australis TaxID=1472297 RepID=UPI000A19E189|nr:hypothetical protein [Magnetofaba australis]
MATELTERQRYWLEHVRASERTGGTLKAYADAQGLDVQEFYNQKGELRRKGLLDAAFEAESRFARLTVEPDALPERRCRMELPNGVTLDLLEPDSAPGWRQLLQAVWSLS